MSLRLKAILIMGITALFFLMGQYFISDLILVKNAITEEADVTEHRMEQLESLLDLKLSMLGTSITDWANWDDPYYYMVDGNENFIDSNVTNEGLYNLKINMMLFLDNTGILKYGKAIELSEIEETPLPDNLSEYLKKDSKLLQHTNPSDTVSGYLFIDNQVMMVTSRAILKSDLSGPSTGTMIFGRYLDSSEIENLEELTGQEISCINVTAAQAPSDVKQAFKVLFSGRHYYTSPFNDNQIAGYALLRDIEGKSGFMLRIVTDRSFLKTALKNVAFYLFSLMLFCMIILIACIILLQKLVVSKLEKLSMFMAETSATRDTSMRLQLPGRDEISKLALETNRMLEEIDKTHQELKYLSYYDQLTGLNNRIYFDSELDKVESSHVLPVTLLMCDINGLKITNDTFGHLEGDRLLCIIANIIKDCCGKNSLTARLGGDEFASILYICDETAAMNIQNNIKNICASYKDFHIKLSIAIGSSTKTLPSQDIKHVLREAEERMYRNKLMESRSARYSIISSLEQTLGERSNETEEHTCRIREMCERLGNVIGLTRNDFDDLLLLSTLHDIGKVGIPDSILTKPGKLTPEEWIIMKRHSEIGYRIALATPELGHIAEAILFHHENFDGTGYPQGLKGEEIPIASRILAIADAYDVMTHQRPYKEAITAHAAIQELRNCSGTQFDPALVEVFIKMLQQEP